MDQPFVKNGLISGFVAIIITLSIYLAAKHLMLEWWVSLLSFAFSIFFMVKSVKDFKNINEGFASFGEAFIQSFGTFFISLVLGSIFAYLLYNVIDTGLSEYIKDAMIEKFEGMESMLGEAGVEAMIEGLEEQGFEMTIGKILQSLLMSSVFGAVIALIIAAITKKNRPEFA